MFQLILASVGFIPWALYIIITYYSENFSKINHIESATGYGGYLLSIGIVYGIYKYISISRETKHVTFNFWHIFGFSLLQILIVSIAYSSAQVTTGSPFFGNNGASSIVLFGHILSLLIYPIFLVFLWKAIWYSLLQFIKWWNDITLRIRFGAEVSIGLALFGLGLILLWINQFYNLNGLIVLILILGWLSYKWWIAIFNEIKDKHIEFPQHEKSSKSIFEYINPKLLSAEFAFVIISFLVSVSLINAIRPMPIGWDDLGSYMNFPRIMAINESILYGVGIFTWQLITGTGFFINQIAANAFYINQLWGILSVIIISCILSIIFELKDRKYILSLPILLAGIYYMMPMTIFQQAKDMKLDPALMMASVSAFGMLWYTLREKYWKPNFYSLLLIVGTIVGIAFGMKLTTLMLIIASLALISYNILGICGFLGFFFIFLGIFTGGHLWSNMNVWMPNENTELIRNITIACSAIWLLSLGLSVITATTKKIKIWLISVLIFIGWIALGLSPWLIKNWLEAKVFTSEQKGTLISGLLWWYSSAWFNNYSAIYSSDEYAKKRKEQQSASITNDGKSQNEDFSRYFGQESGLNNYLKLPANLTFQKNQSGEFTDITFIFFAFLPAILLFVWGRIYGKRKWTKFIYPSFIFLGIIWMISYYFIGSTGSTITNYMNNINLPEGYLYIIGWIIISILVSHFFIEKTEEWNRIQDIIVTVTIYGFLFLISAFGIVWYGVFVYFLFLALIGLASLAFTTFSDSDNDDVFSFKVTLSFIFFLFIFVYVIRSAFPHGWNNLISAWMNEYKYKKIDQNESIFTYRNDYITSIATLNLANPDVVVKRAWSLAKSVAMKKILTPERLATLWASDLHQILLYFITQIESGKIVQDWKAIENDVKAIWNELYSSILSPKWDDINNKWIYRIGTFMTYLINKNQQRYLEDSLVFEFETFFYDPSPEKTIDRMKKVGLGYLLTDLNAATIDRDPRRVLTSRFEHLLLTMRAKNLRLVDTDNLCLRIALDEYKAWLLQTDIEFIDIAWTNYESFRGPDMKVMYRNEKQNKCATYAINLINESSKNKKSLYSYLVPLRDELLAAKTQAEQQAIISRAFGQSYFALFEIIDMPVVEVKNEIAPQNTNTWIISQ